MASQISLSPHSLAHRPSHELRRREGAWNCIKGAKQRWIGKGFNNLITAEIKEAMEMDRNCCSGKLRVIEQSWPSGQQHGLGALYYFGLQPLVELEAEVAKQRAINVELEAKVVQQDAIIAELEGRVVREDRALARSTAELADKCDSLIMLTARLKPLHLCRLLNLGHSEILKSLPYSSWKNLCADKSIFDLLNYIFEQLGSVPDHPTLASIKSLCYYTNVRNEGPLGSSTGRGNPCGSGVRVWMGTGTGTTSHTRTRTRTLLEGYHIKYI
ncbi:hypothetical protein BU15DRAFT_65311 [Melanogaster broomeanus]|nr:hypothetical protein BU15DRAFT_65311 [Melanogaster broomeanus]